MPSVRLRDFPRVFWLANVMELFERAAYYGLNSVLGVYLVSELKFDVQAVGFLQSVVYAAVYVVPILGGALADRYGYRRMLLVAFSLLAAGYFAAGGASSYGVVFVFLLLMALGAGLFKPIISGTLARTTNERTSAIGFGIYYWMINLGAFLAPFVVTWLKRGPGWRAVFTASALYTGAMILPTIFLFRDPARPKDVKPLGETLRGAADVLADARFMLMVVVYSGFWLLYFQQFGSILWYLDDFVDKAPVNAAVNGVLGWFGIAPVFVFDAEHITVINALTIIALQIVVSWIVKERKALPTMVAGMLIGAAGMGVIALSRGGWALVVGMVVFSLGEMTCHPKYYSLVGLVAPPDRKAVYMGYSFLYGVFGALLGSNLGAAAYKSFLLPYKGLPGAGTRAAAFWTAFALLGVLSAAALSWVARRCAAEAPGSERRARRAMTVVYALLVALGALFLAAALRGESADFKSAVQAALFVALGAGGLAVNLRPRRARRSGGDRA